MSGLKDVMYTFQKSLKKEKGNPGRKHNMSE